MEKMSIFVMGILATFVRTTHKNYYLPIRTTHKNYSIAKFPKVNFRFKIRGSKPHLFFATFKLYLIIRPTKNDPIFKKPRCFFP